MNETKKTTDASIISIEKLISIESKYPNDYDLGREIRKAIRKLKENENKN